MKNKNRLEQIAVFGSAFNPPTLGHLSVIKRLSHFDQVLLVPSRVHVWGKAMINFDKRCDWVTTFISDASLANLSLCSNERELGKKGPITTWALLNQLQNQYPNAILTFVIGPDNFLNFGKFHKFTEIMERWNILVCPETIHVRSTDIRNRVIKGYDITLFTTPSLVTKLVKEDFL
ncbi:nicotinate-nicotinamide nucleotide adenylyltransferase [Candidatus Enterovibrio escicola]|uniref:nicotinate-nucleotide adenylyltransferase n=1 Tax=Candidatus Enterovibrio escicola TaxID=1927127 RepID=A0A2A5SZ75_9GAMM|nr:nicotinate-nicotinamide nucleotide adenylyltransferase [Candidatus Enterovibrio escacola]PCS21223.1 Nicotinate-nucleotide adenylyltransferase [Candidatus Enterovibrio escacola]